MSRWRRPMTPRVLRGVVKELREVEAAAEPKVDLEGLHRKIEETVQRMAPTSSDGAILAAVDAHIADWLQTYWISALRHHNSAVFKLDVLATQIRAYIKEIEQIDGDLQDKLSDVNAAVAHSLDRVSDPDLPFFDPVPPQRTVGRR